MRMLHASTSYPGFSTERSGSGCLCRLLQFQQLWWDMEVSDRTLPLKVGLDASGSGSAFVTWSLVSG